MSITQIITQEILKQLKQNLQQAGLTYTETTDTNAFGLLTYTDQNQRSSQISSLFIGHIQLQKWEQQRHSGWSTQADIIIDQQSIIIYSRYQPTNTYELTDPKSIQNAIQTITQKL